MACRGGRTPALAGLWAATHQPGIFHQCHSRQQLVHAAGLYGTLSGVRNSISVPHSDRKLFASPWMLWIILLCVPFPYIANTAGWLAAEVGRQPWLVYGLLRTSQGYSTNVIAGNSLFTLLGYMGLYLVLGILFLFLIPIESCSQARGCFGSSCSACRSPTSLTPPDGLPRRSDASPGWFMGCYAPARDIPPMS